MVRQRRRRLRRLALVLAVVVPAISVIGCCGGFWWTYCVPNSPPRDARFEPVGRHSWSRQVYHRGSEWSTSSGRESCQPEFLRVDPNAITDAAGQATIWPGETEVLAVRVGSTKLGSAQTSLRLRCSSRQIAARDS